MLVFIGLLDLQVYSIWNAFNALLQYGGDIYNT